MAQVLTQITGLPGATHGNGIGPTYARGEGPLVDGFGRTLAEAMTVGTPVARRASDSASRICSISWPSMTTV